jgi:hypothetical protein
MTTRRGFLQTVGAILGSTTIPAGAVLSVAPVAQVAEVSTGAMAIAAVARQFKTTSVIDARSFEPVIGVTVVQSGHTQFIGSHVIKDVIEDYENKSELYKLSVIKEQLELKGLPALTDEETRMFLDQFV